MKQKYCLLILICTLFSAPSFSQFTTQLNFEGFTNGGAPHGSLISDGTFLYGMTHSGGTFDYGTIFKIMPDGSNYEKLLDFEGSSNGSYPDGSLTFDGSFLYGMTIMGGTYNNGTVFKIMPDGTNYMKLLDMSNITSGSYPNGSLYSDGTYLYGMASSGGLNNMGTIFKIMTDGTGFIKLLDFEGTINGRLPYGSLISDGTFLYGMTFFGGTNDDGVLFKVMLDGSAFATLLDFEGPTKGSYPSGSLFFDGIFLYGMSSSGGVNNKGTIFRIMPNGANYMKLFDFDGTTNGSFPYGSLISDGTFLYGLTSTGGADDMGTIFKIKSIGTDFLKLLDFDGTNGSFPNGDLISDVTGLYGMSKLGGTNNKGTIFKFGITSSVTEKNKDLDLSVYPNPTEGIVEVSTSVNGKQLVSISNVLGQKVLTKEMNLTANSPIIVDFSDQPKGIYFVQVGNSVKKVLKR